MIDLFYPSKRILETICDEEIPITTYTLFQKGICYGFQDSGDYFKSEHTKRIYENKIPIIKNQSIENGLQRFRVGVTNFLYPYSDLIEVDTKKGVLYCIQLKESIEIIK